MAITSEEIRKIASLARLELTPEEEVRHAEVITAVLDYMKILNELDTSGIEPTAQVTGLTNIYREDSQSKAVNRDALTKAMPSYEADELIVPGVFAEDE